jgi:hypothetical protein
MGCTFICVCAASICLCLKVGGCINQAEISEALTKSIGEVNKGSHAYFEYLFKLYMTRGPFLESRVQDWLYHYDI